MAEPDQLVVRMDPATGVRFMLDARRAASISPEAITLDMTFAQEGGEGATPYEVLLHAAMVGETNRFMRQDSVEDLAHHAAAARCATTCRLTSLARGGTCCCQRPDRRCRGWREPWTVN